MRALSRARRPRDELERWLARLSDPRAEAYLCNWAHWCRADQRPPPGDWRVWMLLAGRGFGKTRTGAEWVRAIAERDADARIALVAASLHEARQVMVEGESGLLAIASEAHRPTFESSLRRITWPNGAVATLYSAAEPDSLRGPEHSAVWCDEIAKWPQGEAVWDNLMLTMRIGAAPQTVATTTPRGVALVRRLMAEEGVVTTGGTTRANRHHLSRPWLAAMQRLYGGTRLGRQELDGQMLEDVEGALWTRDLIERCRTDAESIGKAVRVVIGVDPPATSRGDACGIVVAAAAARWGADRVVAESNMGGEMVENTLRAADITLPVVAVHASIGKGRRAEPVAIAYERGQVVHAGAFAALEDQLCGLQVGGSYAGPGRSPDRADACVWAVGALRDGLRMGREPGVRRV